MKVKISLKEKFNKVKSTKKYILVKALLPVIFLQFAVVNYSNAQTGTWTAVTNKAPHDNMGVMLLLTNGNVICHNTNGGSYGTGWDMLTPTATGSYANGTWTSIASMNNDRLFFSAQVLPSGEVYVAGGEYGAGGAAGGEVYNPTANTWTVSGPLPHNWNMYDAPSELLYTGQVLEGPEIGANGGQPCNSVEQWSPTTLNYTTENEEPLNHDEALWLKLPDSSVLTIGMPYPNFPSIDSSCRFIPQTNSWLKDNNTPDNIYDEYGFEAGCGTMLPNGTAIFFGATKYNEVYTPTGHATPGAWSAGTNFPTIGGVQVCQPDAEGAMMVNGHELLSVSPIGTSANDEFRTPVYFIEYNYTTNTFTQVTSTIPTLNADSIAGNSCYQTNMLDLPDGTVLVSIDQASISKQYWIYTPGSAAIAQGKPTINSVYESSCGVYKATGKLFNGISEGATEGDDWQMATNYPLIRLTNGTDVYYATTSNWNRIGAIMTDSLEDTTDFVLPTALPTGTYSLVVVANGFASNPTIFVYNPLKTTAAVTAEVTCNGESNGNATATVTGGETPYTYKWANATTTVSTSNPSGPVLSAGTYTVTVTDNIGCTATATVTITQPTAVVITIASHVNATCITTGSATANAATGGKSPYTYAWSPSGGTALTATGLSAGSYTITATDNNGCRGTASVTLTNGTLIRDSVASFTYPACNGGTGSATVGYKDGIAPYTFTWSPNTNTTATASGLSAGTYTVIVNDKNGCPSTLIFTMTQPTQLTVTTTVTSNVTCGGGSNGAVSATASGGTTAYTYAWSGGGTTSTKTALTAGTYTITVTDKHGCTATATTTITQPTQLTVSTSITANVTCNGGANGSASATAAGGKSPYTYAWSGGGTSSTKTALTAGTYTITVTDLNGCTATATAIITQPTLLKVTASVTANESCNGGSNGSVSSAPSGGTSPYTYAWTGGGTNQTETALSAGTYTITLTDDKGCTATASATITQPTLLKVTATTTANDVCNGGSTGSVSSAPSGGTSPYTYAWTGGSTKQTETGLSAGTYTITLTDKNGCTATASTAITQPVLLTVSGSTTSTISCNGASNGTVSASPAGGTSPYTYAWTGGSTKATETGLSAGVYTITVTDKNGCTATASVNLTQPTLLTDAINIIANAGCAGNNGSLSSTIGGGTSPYTYAWTGGSTNNAVSALSAGTYSLVVTDANGCAATASATITQSTLLTVTVSVNSNVACYGGSTGSAKATPSGGTSPYTYSWTGGNTNAIATGLSAGSYTVTVNDFGSCSGTAVVTITQPASALGLTAGVTTDIVCNGGNNGVASANPSGGSSPYTYSWTGGSTNSSATGLTAGTYTVNVIDNNGCSITGAAVVNQPSALVLVEGSENTTTGNCIGTAWVHVTGGTAAYTYLWSNTGTTDTINRLCEGSYCCKVTDANGCIDSVCVTIVTGIQDINNASSIKIYPDPNTGYFTIAGLEKGQIIEMYNYLGQRISSSIASDENVHFNISTETNGVYLIRILNSDGSVITQQKMIKTQ